MFVSGRELNISDRDFNAIRSMIYQEAGISLSDAKRVLVCSRLAKRLRHLHLRSHAEYLDYLATRDPEGAERQVMINCLTTNKTDFFREPHHFTFLRENVFPPIERAAAGKTPTAADLECRMLDGRGALLDRHHDPGAFPIAAGLGRPGAGLRYQHRSAHEGR